MVVVDVLTKKIIESGMFYYFNSEVDTIDLAQRARNEVAPSPPTARNNMAQS